MNSFSPACRLSIASSTICEEIVSGEGVEANRLSRYPGAGNAIPSVRMVATSAPLPPSSLPAFGAFERVGFAVPSSRVLTVIEEVRRFGHYREANLGLSLQRLSPSIVRYLNLDDPVGAIVVQVVPDSPAAKAGLLVGDIILSHSPDLTFWGKHRLVMRSGGDGWWQGVKIGAGPVPIETTEGWLMVWAQSMGRGIFS